MTKKCGIALSGSDFRTISAHSGMGMTVFELVIVLTGFLFGHLCGYCLKSFLGIPGLVIGWFVGTIIFVAVVNAIAACGHQKSIAYRKGISNHGVAAVKRKDLVRIRSLHILAVERPK